MGTASGGRMLRQSAGGGQRFNQHDGSEGSHELRQRYMPLGRPAVVPKVAGTTRILTVSALMAAGAVATYAAALGTGLDAKTATGHALVLALVFFATQSWVVHVHFNREAHSLSLNEIPLTLGLLTVAPAPLLAALVVGSAAALTLVRRQGRLQAMFNVAQLALSGTTAIVVFEALAPPSFGPRVWLAA